MKNIAICSLTIFFFVFASLLSPVFAAYTLDNFESEINVLENRKLKIKETVSVNFQSEMHGIYRVIPDQYSYKGKTINSRLKILSVKDPSGRDYEYQTSRKSQSLQIKIGDPDTYVRGPKIYVIDYEVSNILQKYDSGYELYWNVTGHEWDQSIRNASVNIVSPNADIDKIACYTGTLGTTEGSCNIVNQKDKAIVTSLTSVGYDNDFTVVIGFSPDSNITDPTRVEALMGLVFDNWGYLVSPLPFLVIFYLWHKKGRDMRFVGDNIYYDPEDKKIEPVSPFERKFIPMVYSPIKGLTPAELGTIIDEKVDIKDIVAEIIELARNKFIKLEKIERKKLIGTETDYLFTKLKADTSKLKTYQLDLLTDLFLDDYAAGTIKTVNKFYAKEPAKLKGLIEKATLGDLVVLSSLKTKFYKKLADLKEDLYEEVKNQLYFEGNPEKMRQKYFGVAILVSVLSVFTLIQFYKLTANFYPIILGVLFSIASGMLSIKMPRRTPRGYALYRQIEGLFYYIKKGKWRLDVHEKKLFFEEMLPMAISLGVVDKLARDMQGLGVTPPTYASGFLAGNIAHNMNSFSNTVSSTMLSTPGGRASGGSSWSGGSGFSGGGGGGFGGGGGGGW